MRKSHFQLIKKSIVEYISDIMNYYPSSATVSRSKFLKALNQWWLPKTNAYSAVKNKYKWCMSDTSLPDQFFLVTQDESQILTCSSYYNSDSDYYVVRNWNKDSEKERWWNQMLNLKPASTMIFLVTYPQNSLSYGEMEKRQHWTSTVKMEKLGYKFLVFLDTKVIQNPSPQETLSKPSHRQVSFVEIRQGHKTSDWRKGRKLATLSSPNFQK